MIPTRSNPIPPVQPRAQLRPQTQPQTQPQAQPQLQNQTHSQPQTQPQAQPQIRHQPQPQTQPQPQPQTQPQPQLRHQPQTQPQPQPQASMPPAPQSILPPPERKVLAKVVILDCSPPMRARKDAAVDQLDNLLSRLPEQTHVVACKTPPRSSDSMVFFSFVAGNRGHAISYLRGISVNSGETDYNKPVAAAKDEFQVEEFIFLTNLEGMLCFRTVLGDASEGCQFIVPKAPSPPGLLATPRTDGVDQLARSLGATLSLSESGNWPDVALASGQRTPLTSFFNAVNLLRRGRPASRFASEEGFEGVIDVAERILPPQVRIVFENVPPQDLNDFVEQEEFSYEDHAFGSLYSVFQEVFSLPNQDLLERDIGRVMLEFFALLGTGSPLEEAPIDSGRIDFIFYLNQRIYVEVKRSLSTQTETERAATQLLAYVAADSSGPAFGIVTDFLNWHFYLYFDFKTKVEILTIKKQFFKKQMSENSFETSLNNLCGLIFLLARGDWDSLFNLDLHLQ